MPMFSRLHRRAIAFDKDEGGGSGGSDDGDNLPDDLNITTEMLQEALQGVMPQEVMQSLKSTADDEGGWKQFAMSLANDNKKLRDKNRDLVDAPKGAAIIPPDEADALAEIKKHGDLSDAAKKLREHDKLKQKIQQREKEETAREALQASGVNSEAFLQMDGARDLQYDTVASEQETEDGETVTKQMGVVKVTEEDDAGNEVQKNVPIRQYIEDNYSAFKPVLLEDGETQQDTEEEAEETQQGGGPRMPRRSGPTNQNDTGGSSGSDTSDAAKKYLENKYARNRDNG